ncbi:hypothetical protein F2Q69_00009985 [Brassica cretica]|uniref:Uncharacterized protein n=1 Tax=Brassica cretica TaxID=69181 RepID=A0A8S9NR41_BRACR|nr:hypothetical protein F2Q69_00009985 [Brassica cretica]
MRCCSTCNLYMQEDMWSTRWIGQARGVAMQATGPCGQTCEGHGVSLHGARPCIQTGRGRGVILHETETCSQPCGARGVAAHASGAMRTDTRAATRLVPDCTWRRFCSSEERSDIVETSSRSVWTWVYLRRSRKGSDHRSRVWGQGHGQPKILVNAECLDDIAKLWIVSVPSDLVPGGFKETIYSLDREDSDRRGHGLWLSDYTTVLYDSDPKDCGLSRGDPKDNGPRSIESEPLGLDCLGWDSEGLYLLVGDCNSLSNARLLTPHSLLFQVTNSELEEVAGSKAGWNLGRRSVRRSCSCLIVGRWFDLCRQRVLSGASWFSVNHVLADSICVTHNARHIGVITRRTVDCRAVTRRTVGRGRLKVPSSGLCGEPLALVCLGWDSEGLYLLVGDSNSLSNARLLTPHSLLFQVTSSKLVEVAGGYAGWCRFASFCLRRFQTISEPLALDCLGWDSEGLYLLVGDCNSLSNARLLTPHSLLFSGDQ